MRIFNENKTKEITEYDKNKYYLVEDKLFIKHHEAILEVQKQSHYEVVKEYPNGGKDVKEVIDVEYQPAKDAYDEYEDIFVLKAYTDEELSEIKKSKEEELVQQEIAELKQFLLQTDYQAIKYAEGWLTEEEYAPVKEQRQQWRNRINELEA